MALNNSTEIKELKKFDVDLEFGKHWEEHIDDLFSGAKTCEIKTERDQWATTGNICIEHESWGKPSGINATTSDIWVQNLVKDGELVCSIMFNTDTLRELIKELPQRFVMGGDNKASKLQLVNIQKLMEIVKNGRTKQQD
jgi:hypothetical protein